MSNLGTKSALMKHSEHHELFHKLATQLAQAKEKERLLSRARRDATEAIASVDLRTKQLVELVSSLDSIELLALLGDELRRLKAEAIEDARDQANDWRTTARRLGEADGIQAVESVVALMLSCVQYPAV